MVRILTRLTAAFFLVAASAHAEQPSRLDDIVKRGALRVGMTGDYLPFTDLDRTASKFRGFDVDMAEVLGNALGVKVAYVQTAWPRLMQDFDADKFDIAMGGMSGLDLQQELMRRRLRIPIVFITAHDDEALRPRLLARGAAECLFKPFSERALLDALDAALGIG